MSHLDFDIVSDFDIRISSLCYMPSTSVEIALQISPFYAKQTQSQVSQNQPKHFCSNEIRINGLMVIQTKQSQLKPKQTQFKLKQSQFKLKQSQFKPNQSQFPKDKKMNVFAWIRSFTIVFCDLLAEFTTLRVPILFFIVAKSANPALYTENTDT